MKKRAYSGLSSFLLSRLELKSFAKIGEAYLRGFSARVVSDRIDDFLKAMSSADLWMSRMALVAGALLPTAFFAGSPAARTTTRACFVTGYRPGCIFR